METTHALEQEPGKIPELPSLECLKGRLAQSRREASVLKKLIRLKVELGSTSTNSLDSSCPQGDSEVQS